MIAFYFKSIETEANSSSSAVRLLGWRVSVSSKHLIWLNKIKQMK